MAKLQFSGITRAALLGAAMLVSGAASAANEDEFLAARDAFRVGDARKLDFHARRLNNYVLEPYVAYWQLRLRLEDAASAQEAIDQVTALARRTDSTPSDREAVERAVREVGEL